MAGNSETNKKAVMKNEDYQETVKEVLTETLRAKTLFPIDFHNHHEGYAVILEELDELWDEIKRNQRNYDLVNQRKEAIQCAAMCVRFATELFQIKKPL